MAQTGNELLDTALTLVTSLREDIEQLPDLEVSTLNCWDTRLPTTSTECRY